LTDNENKSLPQLNESVKLENNTKRLSELLEKAKSLPKSPGCYLMQNSKGHIIYVGKAKDLKARVSSYFNKSQKSPKTMVLIARIKDFEFILTNSEAESYVLENNLIKEHKPRYNVRLKDDKSYPYLMVDYSHDFPKLQYVRRPKKKSNMELFGPYPVGSQISATMQVVTKAFQLRDCSDYDFKTRKTPCILFQMNQCSAPCVGEISQNEYAKDLGHALDVFRGKRKSEQTLRILEHKMHDYADKEEFEKAAMLRDFSQKIAEFLEHSFDQTVELNNEKNIDVIAFYKGDDELDISLYMIREGNLLGHKSFHFFINDLFNEIEEEVSNFILQYYTQIDDVLPENIIVDLNKEISENLYQALLKTHDEGLKFKVISKTKKYQPLIDATKKHAQENQRVRIKNQESEFVGLNKLKDLLNMSERPKTLECYDIAIWQGKSPTASQIVFEDGKPDKKRYRYYHLQELPEGNNDFAMMKEVFERRLKYEDFPDVFVVDGGKAQVSTVQKVLAEFKIDVPVVGIAKSREIAGNFQSSKIEKSDERLVIPNRSNPYILSKTPSLMRIIVQMRDEAHRFSRKLHHKKEKGRILTSWLDEVPGIGAKTRDKILQHLTLTKDEVKNLNIKEISDHLGVNIRHARSIYETLHAEEKSKKN
jgi:excinuclease ABC subunit C